MCGKTKKNNMMMSKHRYKNENLFNYISPKNAYDKIVNNFKYKRSK